MKPELFQEVIITRDFPEYNIAKGDIAILNNFVTDPLGEEGCLTLSPLDGSRYACAI
jgi:hypothetical protein